MSNYKSLLSDQPAIEDLLGYYNAAEALANIIINPNTDTPLTIGIFGEWGSGKTSLMKMVQAKISDQLEPSLKIFTIWFDPWRYDDKEAIWQALIQTILLELYSNAASGGHKFEIAKLTAKFIGLITAKTVEVVTVGAVDLMKTLDQVEQIIKPKFDEIRFWNKFETSFSEIVQKLVGETGRLVIFIDDLDRCLPENAIQVLEAIKLFLAQENCIFVLGVEKQAIEEAISLRYKDDSRIAGVKYLEKIIQLPFALPIPRSDDIKAYTHKHSGEEYMPQIQRIIKVGAGNNPRRIKRFINSLNLLRSIASDKDIKESILAKIVMLQLRFPRFYQFLCYNPDAIDDMLALSDGQETPETPDKTAYEEFINEKELRDFLIDTQDIRPDDLWDPYLRLTAMINA